MSGKIQIKKLQHKKSQSQKMSGTLKRILFPLVALVVVSLSWLVYRSILKPTGINEVALMTKIDSSGCYYKQVQCVKAPCEPVLVCPTTTESTNSQICTQVAGSCMGKEEKCVSYSNGCEQARLCNPNISSDLCSAPKKPLINPAADIPADCKSWYDGCNTCMVVNGKITGCTMMACVTGGSATNPPKCLSYKSVSPTPSPSLIPTPIVSTVPKSSFLANFYASSPCGEAHFSSYQYTCSNGQKFSENSLCVSLISAMESARTKCRADL